MKCFLLLISFFVFGECVPVTLYKEISPGVYRSENLTETRLLPRITIHDNDVKIYFRNKDHMKNMVPLDLTDPIAVNKLGFSNEKDTVFIIHGWHNEYDSPICEDVSDAVLKVKDVNVFVVDWSKIAKNFYIVAQAAVPDVAKVVSKLTIDLIENNALILDKTIFVGHSLGAHIAGITGYDLKGKLKHIVGLDPALPFFNWSDEDGRLDPTDAKFVQVIHTCAGLLGFDRDIGHVDYWPNGGKNQPGCGIDLAGSCSHSRSYLYYAESVESSGFISEECESYNDYKDGKCDSRQKSLMGEYEPDTKVSGSYYLETNEKSPFAKN